jgi:hypothetical protein
VADPAGAYAYVLPLGPDTLHISFHNVRRSLDGGETFVEVYDEGGPLFEGPATGALLTGIGVGSGVAYSHDRGATWAEGALDAGSWVPDANAFAELPPGHADAGRLIAGCTGGLSYSDDGGRTWRKSSLWEDGPRYYVTSVAVGVDGAVYAAFSEQWVAGTQVARSRDGGATYEMAYGSGVASGVGAWVVAVPGGADPVAGVVVLVEVDGSVWRSDDAADSFRPVGQVPVGSPPRMDDVLVGPDGRLYAGTTRSGDAEGWVWRTTGPVVTAQEPGAPGETSVVLEVVPNPSRGEATVTLTLGAPSEVAVALYDVLGREVAVLASGRYGAGAHASLLDGSALPPGVYVVRAAVGAVQRGGAQVLARRVTVVR